MDALAYISKFVSLTPAEKELFQEHVQVITCFPRQILTRVGEYEQHVYFVQRGLVRKFFYRNNEEVTVQLALEGELASSSVSFLSGVLSDFVLETLEPSTLAFITKSSLETLFAYSHNFEKMGRLITLQWLLYKEEWDISRLVKSPRERFQMILRDRPELLNRVPQKYIASLLDMKPETFSRFKKMIPVEMEND
ncbi:Crp/Fnr family transcriptional regulator [Flavihumibacter petaseus]|uniref:Cyclic nucleotide-binding domain-containing protein n=1 Tax=Flavihumibacter petaseus NBRC 106054 TaxID=1220578 RepID=A0A0E9N2Q6_9BACT|nr:hypothetical protein [Flavihumibacter petaseus]GAO43615.1 hypothetical protein FPE01S_02_07210 [Flavihumibacter petaseus NBRC 106054]